jgi:hypothetical protein
LPGEANITTAAGDVAVFQSTGANTVQCIAYTKADGTGVVGGGNKAFFVPAIPDQTATFSEQHSFVTVSLLDSVTDNCYGTWSVPSDFSSLTKIEALVIGDGAGNMFATFLSAAVGADDITNGDTDTIAAAAYTLGGSVQVQHLDVTAMANGLTFTAGHSVGLEINRDAANASDTVNTTVRFVGWRVTYA